MLDTRKEAKELGVLLVIPTYNNGRSIASVIDGVKEYVDDILVVNDGSLDNTASILENIEGIQYVAYKENKGKGYAIRTALKYAYENNYNYVISIDADGQHYPENIIDMLQELRLNLDTLIVGARNIEADNMPNKNTFANKFSNFWFFVTTGKKMTDTQSGYRVYPVKLLKDIKFVTSCYEFEVEVIVRAAWRGVKVKNIPIKVYYPPIEERVSHFRPLKDFARISALNTVLVTVALLYYHPKCFIKACNYQNIKYQTRKHILKTSDSNFELSAAMGLGIFFGIFPIWGYQMLTAGFVAHFLRLNKVITVLFTNISIPPMIPLIIYGSYVTGGLLLNGRLDFGLGEISIDTMKGDLLQYILGSVVFAIICGLLMFIFSYVLSTIFKRKVENE